MTDQNVLSKIDQGVALVTINNQRNYNALSKAVMQSVISTLADIAANPDVKAVVMTGAGDKAFSVGLDLKELSASGKIDMGDGERTMGIDAPLVRAFSNLPQPIIGAINGFAVTGGFELALACDFMVCSENAQFADTHALVGIMPGWGLSQKLPRLVGLNRAMEMSFTGRYVGADEAYRLGLVNRVFAQEDLVDEAMKIAKRIAIADPVALPKIKKVMTEGGGMSLADALKMEGDISQAYNDRLDLSYLEQRLEELKELAKA